MIEKRLLQWYASDARVDLDVAEREVVLTYVLPAIPLVVLFDGIVSCLRSYTLAELEALVRGVGEGRMRWQVGEAGRGPVPMSYVIGEPVGD